MDGVLYTLGTPDFVIDTQNIAPVAMGIPVPPAGYHMIIHTSDLPSQTSVTSYTSWAYKSQDGLTTQVSFERNGGLLTTIACSSDVSMRCPSVDGLSTGSSEDDVTVRLGNADYSETSNGVRTLYYKNDKLTFLLKKKRVVSVMVGSQTPTGASLVGRF